LPAAAIGAEFFHRICELTVGLRVAERAIVRPLYVRSRGSSKNVSAQVASRRQRESGLGLRAGIALLVAAALTACAPPQPEPRTVLDFMDDGLAREGVLTRCNQNRDATLADEECANARRASAAVALVAERARESGLERESETKLLALPSRGSAAKVFECLDPLMRCLEGIHGERPPEKVRFAVWTIIAQGTGVKKRLSLERALEHLPLDWDAEAFVSLKEILIGLVRSAAERTPPM
jgi:hypothetical protein